MNKEGLVAFDAIPLAVAVSPRRVPRITRAFTKLFGPRPLAFLAALGFAVPALAAGNDPDWFSPVIGASVTYDDNLFRLSPGADPQTVLGRSTKSDWIASANLGVKIDKPYGLQRFQLDAMETRYRYQNATFLNHDTFEYRGAWLWQLTPRLGGEISIERTQALVNYADYRVYSALNLQTNQFQRAKFDWWAGGGWHVLGGVVATESRNSQVFNAVGNFDQNTAEAGVRYITRDDSSLTFIARSSRGEYQGRVIDPVNVLDNHFTQQEGEVRGIWRYSQQSLFDGRLGYLDRHHANFSQRDYQGPVGRLGYTWTPDAKLRFDVFASRDLYSFQELTNSYYVSNVIGIVPNWLISEKTTAHLRLDRATRDFRGAVVATPLMRFDTVRSASAGIDWKATRGLLVTGEVRREQRDSNFTGFDYKVNVVTVKAQLTF